MESSVLVEKRPTPADVRGDHRPVYHLVCSCQDVKERGKIAFCHTRTGPTKMIHVHHTPAMELCVICREVLDAHKPCPMFGKPV